MLANELAEVVTHCPSTAVSVGRLRRKFLRLGRGCGRVGEGTYFLDGADADAIGLAQSSVDSTSFGNTHFGTLDKEGHIGGIGITVTNKTFALRRLVHGGLERPSCRRRF